MKYLKIASWILILVGIVLVIIAFIIPFVIGIILAGSHYSWVASDGLFWIGFWLLPIGLLGLIIFYVYPLASKGKERPQEQVVIKKTRTPAIAGILYIITGLLYPFLYYYLYGKYYIEWDKSILISFIRAFGPSLIGIFTGVCLLLRRFWWLSFIGALLVFIPFAYNIIIGYDRFLVPQLSALLILLFVFVLLSKKEFR